MTRVLAALGSSTRAAIALGPVEWGKSPVSTGSGSDRRNPHRIGTLAPAKTKPRDEKSRGLVAVWWRLRCRQGNRDYGMPNSRSSPLEVASPSAFAAGSMKRACT